MIRRIQIFLGPTFSRILVAWVAITGLASLILNVIVNQYAWVRPVQSLIVIAFLLGLVIIFFIRLSAEERGNWAAIVLPALVAVALGLMLAPQLALLFMGLAVGWIIAMLLITRNRMPVEYRQAVKFLRKSEYAEAVKVMDKVILADSNHPYHYKFRAEIYRLWGKLKQAARDYQKMTELEPDSPVGFNGLAEVYLQNHDYDLAEKAAVTAQKLAPDDWVTYYNLGMIEDRLKQSESVVEHLQKALSLKVPDTRHHLLIDFYLLRAYGRLGRMSEANKTLASLKKQTTGLEEWQTILKDDQAATLRQVIGDDLQTVYELLDGDLKVEDLRLA
ncbi:MAG: tetratricopeptide repeat protein [Anaerolineaceae bacterium]|nr:tetratricopeptide repeat protein [Anaerolineaceae bacterium]